MNPWALLNLADGWSIYGTKMAETRGGPVKCWVIASTKVSTMQMSQMVGMEEFERGDFMAHGWRDTIMTQRFGGDMGLGCGDTFQEAMLDLFSNWDPDKGRIELPSHPRELEGGTPELMPAERCPGSGQQIGHRQRADHEACKECGLLFPCSSRVSIVTVPDHNKGM